MYLITLAITELHIKNKRQQQQQKNTTRKHFIYKNERKSMFYCTVFIFAYLTIELN
jgi:fucose permease